jgi:uncharacterized protein (TIGR02231 family)
MKRMILAAAFLWAGMAQAQKRDTVYSSATISKATVYYGYGADLAHSTKANLVNGVQEVIISNVAFQPDINTLQVSCPENVTILSYQHRIYTKPTPPLPPKPTPKGYDTIKLLQKDINQIVSDMGINDDQLIRISKLIENNFMTPEKKNISSEELIKLTTYYADKASSLKHKNYELQVKRLELQEKINDIHQRISELEARQNPAPAPEKPVGQLILQVMTNTAGPANFDFNYFTRNAGWSPTYDIRVKSIDNSFKLVYKAMVSQTTGLNWNGIKLNLSTSNPNQGNTIPVLKPIYLQMYTPVVYESIKATAAGTYMNSPQLDEVVVTAYDNDKYKYQKKNLTTSNTRMNNNNVDDLVQDYLTLKESQLNTNYEIDLPYTIPSDGQSYSVNIKEQKVVVDYQHISIPKLDRDAFLIARLNSWDSLNLLPGQANVIMDNVYLGKTLLDPNITDDTLNLSLGRDKRIAVDRKLVKEFSSAKRIEGKVDSYTYEITIKNNKNKAVEMVLKDQIPVSQVKEVEVLLTNDGNANLNTETGILEWSVKLKPGESKKYRFSYKVKYPKDKMIQEIR